MTTAVLLITLGVLGAQSEQAPPTTPEEQAEAEYAPGDEQPSEDVAPEPGPAPTIREDPAPSAENDDGGAPTTDQELVPATLGASVDAPEGAAEPVAAVEPVDEAAAAMPPAEAPEPSGEGATGGGGTVITDAGTEGLDTADADSTDTDAAGQEKLRVLILNLDAHAVETSTVAVLNNLIGQALSGSPAIDFVTARDLKTLVELEAEKTVMGCDSSACLVEVAGALGARYVVFGSVGRLGETYVVELNLFDVDKASAIERREVRSSSLDELADPVQAAAVSLIERFLDPADPLRARLVTDAGAEDASWFPSALLIGGSAGLIVGAIGGVVGGAAYGWATAVLNGLPVAPATLSSAETKNGGTLNLIGLGGLALVSVAIVIGAASTSAVVASLVVGE